MKKYDSREVERYELPSELSVVYEGSSEKILTRPTDLSIRGMFIHTPRVFPEGSILIVHFRLRRVDFVLKVRAEVRHCISGTGVGVEFLDLTPEGRWAIERELAIADPSDAGGI